MNVDFVLKPIEVKYKDFSKIVLVFGKSNYSWDEITFCFNNSTKRFSFIYKPVFVISIEWDLEDLQNEFNLLVYENDRWIEENQPKFIDLLVEKLKRKIKTDFIHYYFEVN